MTPNLRTALNTTSGDFQRSTVGDGHSKLSVGEYHRPEQMEDESYDNEETTIVISDEDEVSMEIVISDDDAAGEQHTSGSTEYYDCPPLSPENNQPDVVYPTLPEPSSVDSEPRRAINVWEPLSTQPADNMDTLFKAVLFVEAKEAVKNGLVNSEAIFDQEDEEIRLLLRQENPETTEQMEPMATSEIATETAAEAEATPAIVRYTIDDSSPSSMFPTSGNGSSFVHISSTPVQQCFKVIEQSPPPSRPPPAPKSPPEQQHIISSTTSGTGGAIPRRAAVTTPSSTFEIMPQSGSGSNHLVIDESGGNGNNGGISGDPGRRQRPPMPMVLRQGTREVHNKLEKDRRAHLKECFEQLKKQLPSTSDEKKTSNLNILHSANRYIMTLKKKERDLDTAREAIQREQADLKKLLNDLKSDVLSLNSNYDMSTVQSEGDISVSPPQVMPQPMQVVPEVKHEAQQPQLVQQQQQATTATVVMTAPPASSSSASISNGNGVVTGTPTRVVAKVPQAQLAAITTTTAPVGTLKEVSGPSLQTTFGPVIYHQGPPMVLQKLAIVHQPSAISKNLGDIFLQQQINGKVFPVMNGNYVVKPVVVVSRPNS